MGFGAGGKLFKSFPSLPQIPANHDPKSPNTPAIVLAAAFSRRMGRCKLTLTLDGEPLVRRAVRAALDAGLARARHRAARRPRSCWAVSGFDARVETSRPRRSSRTGRIP